MKAITTLFLVALLLAACAPTSGETPEPGQPTGEPQGGAVYVETADLLIMESYPVQVNLHVTGNLPTPCHSFHYAYQIGSASDRFRVDVTAWSEADPAAMCAQVLQPFDETISLPMTGAADGSYSVYLNGEFVGEFNYPG
jgi:hypothetical protein